MKSFYTKFIFILSFVFVSLFLFSEEAYASGWEEDYDDIVDLEIMYDSSDPMKPIYIEQYGTTQSQNLQSNAWNTTYSKAHGILIGISGVFSLIFVHLFIMNALKLGTTAGNPQERQKVLKGLMWNGIGAGGFAISGVIMALAFGIFNE